MIKSQFQKKEFPFLGYGLGLRSAYNQKILEGNSRAHFFEALTENYLGIEGGGQGWPLLFLEKIRKNYPIVFHGVSMSIGNTDPLNLSYLKKLKILIQMIQPEWVSDHLCWTGFQNKYSHDLLPIPYTQESLNHFSERLLRVQDFLGQPLLIENPSSYIEFKQNEMSEVEFINELVRLTDCSILFDVNNVFVNASNHQFSAAEYIDKISISSIGQIHLAGHIEENNLLIDTHDQFVKPEVWELYSRLIQRSGPISTLLEWDDHIPDLNIIENELFKAQTITDSFFEDNLFSEKNNETQRTSETFL